MSKIKCRYIGGEQFRNLGVQKEDRKRDRKYITTKNLKENLSVEAQGLRSRALKKDSVLFGNSALYFLCIEYACNYCNLYFFIKYLFFHATVQK